MAQPQDLDVLSKETDAYAHTPAQRTEMRIQLAQAEQTSRLADAVEGIRAGLDEVARRLEIFSDNMWTALQKH